MTSLHTARQETTYPVVSLPVCLAVGRQADDAGFPFSQRQSATCADDFRALLAELTAQIRMRWDCNNSQCAPEVMR